MMASRTYLAVGTAYQLGHMSPGTLRLLHGAAVMTGGQRQTLQASQGLGQNHTSLPHLSAKATKTASSRHKEPGNKTYLSIEGEKSHGKGACIQDGRNYWASLKTIFHAIFNAFFLTQSRVLALKKENQPLKKGG